MKESKTLYKSFINSQQNIKNIHEITQKNSGHIIWLYGRPSSGKTTIAKALWSELNNLDKPCITLDGDELRAGLNSDLGFSPSDRQENFRRAVEIAKIFSNKGYYVVCSFITPTLIDRELVRSVANGYDLKMVYVNASLQTCIKRDVKGLYQKAMNGEIKNFTGISAPFDVTNYTHMIDTEENSIADSLNDLKSILNISPLRVISY
jgi:adenylyl-sulfate kinase